MDDNTHLLIALKAAELRTTLGNHPLLDKLERIIEYHVSACATKDEPNQEGPFKF